MSALAADSKIIYDHILHKSFRRQPYTRVEQKIILFHFGNQFNKRWLYVSGLDVLGQSPRHNISSFIELSCYLNGLTKIAYIMLNKYSDSDSIFLYKMTMIKT